MPNFVIHFAHSFSNKGDNAMISSLLQGINEFHPQSKIFLLCKKKEVEKNNFMSNVKLYDNLFPNYETKLPKFLQMFVGVFKTLWYVLWIKFNSIPIDNNAKRILNIHRESDIIIFGGGGYLGGPYRSLSGILVPIFLTKQLGCKVYLTGITIEFPKNFLLRNLIRWVLNKVDLITVREPLSIEVLKSIDVKVKTLLTADLAFMLKSKPSDLGQELLKQKGFTKKGNITIGINLRQNSSSEEIPPDIFISYKETMKKFIESLLEKIDCTIVLIPIDTSHYQDDRIINQSVKKLVSDSLQDRIFAVRDDFSLEETMSIIGSMDILIGTRFHSNVFSIMSGTPFISIIYMQKNLGLMKMMGLEEWAINISELETKLLLEKTQKLIQSSDKVKKLIRYNVTQLQKASLMNILLIDELLKS